MELTEDQERKIKAIMADMECPKGFRCYESKFEDLGPVEAFPGSYVVECRGTDRSSCLMSFTFDIDMAICACPLRRYVALELGG